MAFESKELAKISAAGRAIAEAAKVGADKWVLGVSGVILRDWTANIDEADATRIPDRARGRVNKELGITRSQNQSFGSNPFQVSINTGGRKGKPEVVYTRNPKTGKWQFVGMASGGTFTPANRHWTAEKWALISAGASKFANLAPEAIRRGKSAAGLARQAVIQVADNLGIALESVRAGFGLGSGAIATARGAIASDGKSYTNGTGSKQQTPNGLVVEMVNSYPRNKQAKAAEALEIALARQTVDFQSNLQKDVFSSVEKTIKAYPYLSS